MMTQTHLLVAAALLAKPGEKLRNTAVIIGSFVPDAAIYTLFVWSKIASIPESKVWDEIYWQEPWQSWTAAGNSIPLYCLLLLLGLIALRAHRGAFRIGLVLTFLSLAALTHIAADLPVHVDDAHRHLWPLSDWKFISPVSYWDPDHHGGIFSILESAFGVALTVVLFRRFNSLWVRFLLVNVCLAYVGVPLYFIFVLGG
ncbi:MAG: hypothetical protein OXR62_11125 [Ahrensia sp.]|nr:hypothetical protein [Ahrensia sp.]